MCKTLADDHRRRFTRFKEEVSFRLPAFGLSLITYILEYQS